MRSNRFLSIFGITTFGESHGKAIGLVIEDVKPNIDFPYDQLNLLLKQRKPNSNPYSTTRNEKDEYQVISGIFEGKTTGMPICILFWNKDANSADYVRLKDVFRPGHADYSWFSKFKIYDYRGSGRASGRETISRVAASAFVTELIKPIEIRFQTVRIGHLVSESDEFYQIIPENPFCWANRDKQFELYTYLDRIKSDKDSVGGIIKIKIDNVPIGLGDPVFEKLNASLAKAIMSIGSIKGVSFGDGFEIASLTGSQANDQMNKDGFLSNNAGGITGGISTGQPIIITIAIKPISSHGKLQKTITKNGEEIDITVTGRHDVCHIPRILPVIEAMIKLCLADAIAWQKQITGQELNINDYRESLDKIDEDLLLLLYRRKKVVEQVKTLKIKSNLEFRDEAREQAIAEQWTTLADELGLDKTAVLEILDKVLEVCRIDHTDSSL